MEWSSCRLLSIGDFDAYIRDRACPLHHNVRPAVTQTSLAGTSRRRTRRSL